MHFISETTIILLEAVSIGMALYIFYFLVFDRQTSLVSSKSTSLGTASLVMRSIEFALVIAASLILAQSLSRGGTLLDEFAVLMIGWLAGAVYYFALLRNEWTDERIRYAMLLWATFWLLAVLLLLMLWWSSDLFEFDPKAKITIDGQLFVQLINNTAQIIGIVIAATMIVVTILVNARQANDTAQQTIYQTLEIESVKLFRFECDHPYLVAQLWFPTEAAKMEESQRIPECVREYQLRQYVCQILNLFEMALRFRKKGISEPEVFGSWIIWMWELCREEVFQRHWIGVDGINTNYVKDFRKLIDEGIAIARRENGDEFSKRTAFFEYISTASLGGCSHAKHWLVDTHR